ncbi:iron-siderophore ABC transporter substrate-binding protein [soil metagenome]
MISAPPKPASTTAPVLDLTALEREALVSALTRRKLFTAAAAIAALGATGTLAQSTPIAGEWPRTLQGTFGEVVIPAKPVRIVAASDWYEVDYLIAMGVKPILYCYTNRYDLGVSPWLIAAGGDTLEHYDIIDNPDLERIVAANPDLIVADPAVAEEVAEPLKKIAPTLGLPTPYTGSKDWREAQILLGQACGTETEAAAAIAETEAAIASGKDRLAAYSDRSVTILYSYGPTGNIYGTGEDESVAGLFRTLGVQFSSPFSGSAQSTELIGEAKNADILFNWDIWGSPEFLEANDVFQTLPAVQEGRYEVLSGPAARAIFGPTTLSIRWVIDELVEKIILAANSNGKRLPTS